MCNRYKLHDTNNIYVGKLSTVKFGKNVWQNLWVYVRCPMSGTKSIHVCDCNQSAIMYSDEMKLKPSSVKWRTLCSRLNVMICIGFYFFSDHCFWFGCSLSLRHQITGGPLTETYQQAIRREYSLYAGLLVRIWATGGLATFEEVLYVTTTFNVYIHLSWIGKPWNFGSFNNIFVKTVSKDLKHSLNHGNIIEWLLYTLRTTQWKKWCYIEGAKKNNLAYKVMSWWWYLW